jgi:hypothetical protein
MKNDPNLRNKLTGAYQRMSGSENAAEIEILSTGGKTPTKTSVNNKITVILNGEEGVIDASQWEAFRKKYPTAKRK